MRRTFGAGSTPASIARHIVPHSALFLFCLYILPASTTPDVYAQENNYGLKGELDVPNILPGSNATIVAPPPANLHGPAIPISPGSSAPAGVVFPRLQAGSPASTVDHLIPSTTIAIGTSGSGSSPTVSPTFTTASSSNGFDPDPTATALPLFPTRSVSCQQCMFFYSKLLECNRIANQTLEKTPQSSEQTSATASPGNSTNTTNSPGSSRVLFGGYGYYPETMMPFFSMSKLFDSGSSTAIAAVSDPIGNGTTMTTTGSSGGFSSSTTYADHTNRIDFSAILPFLQCICPNQGLAAARICMTCFQVSNQPNYLSELTEQNVTNSLNIFAQACAESGNGKYIPSAGVEDQEHSRAASGAFLGGGRQTGNDLRTALLFTTLGLMVMAMA